MTHRRDAIYIALQKACPQHALTALAGFLSKQTQPWLAKLLIRSFISYYHVDLSIAERKKIESYQSFEDFFTRTLDPQSRPINHQDPSPCSPVDGTLSAWGSIEDGQFYHAKGHDFTLASLMGGHESHRHFTQGQFLTAYLGPADYHRIHCPLDATLLSMTAIPGKLFAVNPTTVHMMPDVLARNERVVSLFQTAHGKMAVVMIGAMIVGSIKTTWAGCVRERSLKTFDYHDQSMTFQKGDELGQFGLGSCVMVLFESGPITLDPTLQIRSPLQMGQHIGHIA